MAGNQHQGPWGPWHCCWLWEKTAPPHSCLLDPVEPLQSQHWAQHGGSLQMEGRGVSRQAQGRLPPLHLQGRRLHAKAPHTGGLDHPQVTCLVLEARSLDPGVPGLGPPALGPSLPCTDAACGCVFSVSVSVSSFPFRFSRPCFSVRVYGTQCVTPHMYAVELGEGQLPLISVLLSF